MTSSFCHVSSFFVMLWAPRVTIIDLCEGEGRSRRNSAGLGCPLRRAHSEKRGLEALTRSLDSTHSSLPGLLWHFFLRGGVLRFYLGESFSREQR